VPHTAYTKPIPAKSFPTKGNSYKINFYKTKKDGHVGRTHRHQWTANDGVSYNQEWLMVERQEQKFAATNSWCHTLPTPNQFLQVAYKIISYKTNKDGQVGRTPRHQWTANDGVSYSQEWLMVERQEHKSAPTNSWCHTMTAPNRFLQNQFLQEGLEGSAYKKESGWCG
jgi:hypothetical protein